MSDENNKWKSPPPSSDARSALERNGGPYVGEEKRPDKPVQRTWMQLLFGDVA